MKKLFALLSALVLSIAIIGLSTPNAKADEANGKWTVDPTLAEDEIPMYEMGSIYTTFPNYYDNSAKPDSNWGGASRMYPWNETRLRIAQYDDSGATGKYYAVYFSGLTSNVDTNGNPAIGAGNNINGYQYVRNADGSYDKTQVTTVRVKNPRKADSTSDGKVTDGTFTYNATPADPSMSHMRLNFTGEDIAYDGIELAGRINDSGNAHNFYNRVIVFDGEGRIIRGTGTDSFYLKPGADGAAETLWAPLFCRVNGEVVLYVEGETVPDKVKTPKLDEDGQPVVGDNGPEYEETDEDDFVYKRFIWEWFEQKPENVNEVGWMSEGWDCDLWDYVIDAPDGEGYIAIAFVNGEGTNHKINESERAITNATRSAAGQGELAEGDHYRECVREIRVPANGGTYDFGYLDKQVVTEVEKFNSIVKGGFYFGRTTKSVEVKTYNFSTTGLKTNDKVINGKSYQLMDGKNVVEVMQGETFKPASIVLYDGLASGYQTENDVLSYEKDLDGLEYTMYVNGSAVVMKSVPYTTQKEMVDDFWKDLNAYLAVQQGYALNPETSKYEKAGEDGAVLTYTDVELPTADDIANTNWGWQAPAYGALNNKIFATNDNDTFIKNDANWEKWSWLFEYFTTQIKDANPGAADYVDTATRKAMGSIGNCTATFLGFLVESKSGTLCKVDWSTGRSTGWIPEDTNQNQFVNYEINTADDHIDKAYTVQFTVKNKNGNVDTMTIKFVVVDVYTPIIKVNRNALTIRAQDVDGKKVLRAIDPTTLVTAYNGKYNGSDILGDDITQNVHFESDTLDFNNPTEGTHKVTATVYNDAKHYAQTTFNVMIEDFTAPYVEFYGSLVLPYGTTWDPKLAVKEASDNVDGNLLNATFTWCVDLSSTKVNTTKPGTYKVNVSVYDSTGNETPMDKAIDVVVLPQNASATSIEEQTELLTALQSALEQVGFDVTDVKDAIDGIELPEGVSIDEIKQAITEELAKLPAGLSKEEVKQVVEEAVAGIKSNTDTIVDKVNTIEPKGCSKKSAMVMEFLAAGCLLVFLLRKKH